MKTLLQKMTRFDRLRSDETIKIRIPNLRKHFPFVAGILAALAVILGWLIAR